MATAQEILAHVREFTFGPGSEETAIEYWAKGAEVDKRQGWGSGYGNYGALERLQVFGTGPWAKKGWNANILSEHFKADIEKVPSDRSAEELVLRDQLEAEAQAVNRQIDQLLEETESTLESEPRDPGEGNRKR